MAPTSSSTVGVLPPPPGVTPDFEHPKSIAYRIIILAVVFPVFALPICVVRLYTKRFILRLVTCDDFTIILATILSLGYSILCCYQTENGLGVVYFWELPQQKWDKFLKIGGIAGPLFYNLGILFTKVSLSLLYLRLSLTLGLCFRLSIYAVMIVSAGHSSVTAFGLLWLCRPIQKYWNMSMPTGSCIDFDKFFLAISSINVATDLALLILPIRIIHHLNIPWQRKLTAALLLMAGSFVCVVSIIRVRIVIGGMGKKYTDGTTGVVTTNTFWMLIELWFGVICACLSTLHGFFRNVFSACRIMAPKSTSPAAAPEMDVREQNHVRSQHHIPTSLAESAYYSGETSNASQGTISEPPKSPKGTDPR